MDTPMAEPEFLRYAEAQAAYGHHLLGVHRRDGTGCCTSCGRPHPCDRRVHGGRLIVHYQDWGGHEPGPRQARRRTPE
ncbi:hypothetical protein [Catellatospora paridis]|uniref:hypothetical protein n=1 Tax=Catellatospora paridis TaxID=1617086 RepID=UPI0012D468B4|nr:hypothetical protein [Catellatospora paridis]